MNGYEDTCEFYRAVRYMDTARNAIDISQLIPLVDSSTTCRQLVRWRCRHSIISWNSITYTYLHNRNGEPMAYFGNATYRSAGRFDFSSYATSAIAVVVAVVVVVVVVVRCRRCPSSLFVFVVRCCSCRARPLSSSSTSAIVVVAVVVVRCRHHRPLSSS